MTLYIDCTSTRRNPLQTGIQRVVRNLVRHSRAEAQRRGIEITPVYVGVSGFHVAETDPDGNLRIALGAASVLGWKLRAKRVYWATLATVARPLPEAQRDWLLAPATRPGFSRMARRVLHGLHVRQSAEWRDDGTPSLRLSASDTLLALDLNMDKALPLALDEVRAHGARVVTVCYDLIPYQFPEGLPRSFIEDFQRWMQRVLAPSDAIVAISRTVARDAATYVAQVREIAVSDVQVQAFRLGFDFGGAFPGGSVRKQVRDWFEADPARPVFMAVGWLDIRKNQQLLVEALLLLRALGVDARLVLFGKRGPTAHHLLRRIRRSPELSAHVVVCEDASDAEIDFAYRNCTALLYPSVVEGFGLPLVEALGRGARVFASDIPVFREIASDSVVYFNPHDPAALARKLADFCRDGVYATGHVAGRFHWPSWEESAREFFDCVLARSAPP